MSFLFSTDFYLLTFSTESAKYAFKALLYPIGSAQGLTKVFANFRARPPRDPPVKAGPAAGPRPGIPYGEKRKDSEPSLIGGANVARAANWQRRHG